MNLQYNYDNVGNITQITDNVDSTKTRTFVYDELNRLIEANSPSYGGNLVYQYDKIGNMTYNCRYGYYFYEDPNHVHAVTTVKKADGTIIDQYTYDANGNMISGAGRDFTYDYDNRPTSITYNSLAVISVYDASGQRVKKVTPTSTTTYIGDIYECKDGSCTKYIFAGSQRIAKIDNTNTYFYHSDHLGSSTVLTDTSANTAQEIYYYPYGEIKTSSGSMDFKHKYTGKEYDAETGLYYYGARYYDPRLARFISADTIVPNPINPQSLNRYSYVLNNPLIYVDPSGNFFWVAVAIGALIGGASAAVQGGDLGDILTGMAIGAVSGAVGYGAGIAASSFVSASSATVTSVVAGSAGGMAAGATSAALTGGNIGQGALIGLFAGGIGGYIGTINFNSPYLEGMVQIGSGGLVGGAASELTGGKFSEGLGLGAISGAVAFGTNRILDAMRNEPGLTEQTTDALEVAEKYDVSESKLRSNPLKSYELKNANFDEFKGVYKSLGNEIDYIRTHGRPNDIPQLRFKNFHIKQHNGRIFIHYDPYDPVRQPLLHFLRDDLKLF